ncbi:MAG: carbonic anhydrase family protein [Leptolyngbyaceae cyanobacterium]
MRLAGNSSAQSPTGNALRPCQRERRTGRDWSVLEGRCRKRLLRPVWQAIPRQKAAAKRIPDVQVEMARLLPSDRTMFRYFGSLTTPPCSEIVKWLVFQEPIEISPAQVAQFRDIFPLNARPVQSLNRRFVLHSL